MSRSTLCTSCLRALRSQTRKALQSKPQQPHLRLLTTTPRALAQQQEEPKPRFAKPEKPPPPPPPPPAPPSSGPPPDLAKNIASSLRSNTALRSTTEPYIAYGATELLFRACADQCSYTIPSTLTTPPAPAPKNAAGEDIGVGEGYWLTPKPAGGLGLEVTFSSWSQVMFLHMYILTARLRQFPKEHVGVWHQNLLDHFFYAAEARMATWHGMSARGVRNKYLKDLWLQWRGVLLSYDEGLVRGDAVLAAAVWRNLFRGAEGVEVGDLAVVVGWLRRELGRVGGLGDEVLTEGRVGFENPGVEVREVVGGMESVWMTKGV